MPGAASLPTVVGHVGKENQLFPRRTNGRRADLVVPQLLADCLLGLKRAKPLEMRCVSELDTVIIYQGGRSSYYSGWGWYILNIDVINADSGTWKLKSEYTMQGFNMEYDMLISELYVCY